MNSTSAFPFFFFSLFDAGSLAQVPLPFECAPAEGGLLHDVEAQQCFMGILQRLRGELPHAENREELFSYARYYSLLVSALVSFFSLLSTLPVGTDPCCVLRGLLFRAC